VEVGRVRLTAEEIADLIAPATTLVGCEPWVRPLSAMRQASAELVEESDSPSVERKRGRPRTNAVLAARAVSQS
jgi:hypothetical protein